jgi:hypothetical protein
MGHRIRLVGEHASARRSAAGWLDGLVEPNGGPGRSADRIVEPNGGADTHAILKRPCVSTRSIISSASVCDARARIAGLI